MTTSVRHSALVSLITLLLLGNTGISTGQIRLLGRDLKLSLTGIRGNLMTRSDDFSSGQYGYHDSYVFDTSSVSFFDFQQPYYSLHGPITLFDTIRGDTSIIGYEQTANNQHYPEYEASSWRYGLEIVYDSSAAIIRSIKIWHDSVYTFHWSVDNEEHDTLIIIGPFPCVIQRNPDGTAAPQILDSGVNLAKDVDKIFIHNRTSLLNRLFNGDSTNGGDFDLIGVDSLKIFDSAVLHFSISSKKDGSQGLPQVFQSHPNANHPFPNPSNESVSLICPEAITQRYLVLNALGQELTQGLSSAIGKIQINTHMMVPGTYFLFVAGSLIPFTVAR